ncbi:MAG: hypothetical protein ABSF94_08335 [Steroidobacteraceae bacterium]|jgi:hypothetical protein
MRKAGLLIVAAATLTVMSSVASATPTTQNCGRISPIVEFIDEIFNIVPDCHKTSVQAPEIDRASTIGAVTLLLGGLLVLRGRKARA